MHQPENYYAVLGVTKATTDMEVRQAYNLLVERLRSKTTADTQAQAEQQMQLLDIALHTLLNPAKRKRHDEKLDWFVAKARLAADRARDAAMRHKQAQDTALEREKAAQAAEKHATEDAARRVAEETRHRAELAQMETRAAERFRQLREERLPFLDTDVPPTQSGDTLPFQPEEHVSWPADNPEDARAYLHSLARKVGLGSLAVVLLSFMLYLLLRPVDRNTSAPTNATLAASAPVPPCAASAMPCETTIAQPATASAQTANPKPDAAAQKPQPTLPTKSAKADSAKAAEQLLYQKVLRRVEVEHPELNPDHAGHRADLLTYVASRVNVHVKEGYPRSKALDIAVRDLETQEQTKHMQEKFRSSQEKSQPQATPVLDKGEHQGYDPKCRWVTPEQWSCK
jgi:hypothetical protein